MRFTNQKRNHPFKNIVISVIIFLSVAGLFNYGVQSMSKQSIDEQQTNLVSIMFLLVTIQKV